ncbi:hypothetical protein SMB01_15515 [Escherichia coli]|uniref:glycine-rich domain-containing protein n=1 Tax=Escherichia coli TaxID=562 RepID=UPI00307A7DAE
MNRSDSPKKQPKPFGVNGQRGAILPTTPAGDNSASYEQGFPPITMILKSAGGLPPKGQDMNQILYELSALGRWSSTGALNTFDSEFASEISGYPSGAMLISDDGERIFINTTEGNLSDPNNNGAGWKDVLSYLGLGDASGYVGRWLNTRVFTSSGTYTPTPGTKRIRVTITGGGGGGGGCQAISSNETFFGAGGGAGGTVITILTPTQNSYPVTIGAGGAGGVGATNGIKGGDSLFASLIAPGGEGGGKSGVTNTNGGNGGVPSIGNIKIIGGCGGDGQSGNIGVSGEGGVSYWGGGGRAGAGGGVRGRAFGSGGGGAYDAGYSGTSMTGGKGAAGVCIIEEFA